jgi:hypothetical protein
MPVPHRRITGKIRYTSDKPDRKGKERGREEFTMTVHADGRRTLRAYVEIDDAPNVMRDVVLSMSDKWQPTDCFVRLSVGDEFKGSSWFRFDEHGAQGEGYTAAEGRFSQTWPLDEPLGSFGTHPIQGDAWLMSVADVSGAPNFKVYKNLLMCSLDHRGATGPMLMAHPLGVPLAFVGRERITVEAGTFDALHFRISETNETATDTRNEPGKHPPYDLWCTADGDYILLLAYVTGYMLTRYELTELKRFAVTA